MNIYARIAAMLASIVVGGIAGVVLDKATDPNSAKIEQLNTLPTQESSTPRPALLVTTRKYAAAREQARLGMKSADRAARHLMGGLIGGSIVGLGGFFFLRKSSPSKTGQLPKVTQGLVVFAMLPYLALTGCSDYANQDGATTDTDHAVQAVATESDFNEALKRDVKFLEAAQRGEHLATLLISNKNGRDQLIESLGDQYDELWVESLTARSPAVLYVAGSLHLLGTHRFPQSDSTARTLIPEAAEAGFPPAMATFGRFLVEENRVAQAEEWFKRGANANHLRSMVEWADLLAAPPTDGVSKDMQGALRLYVTAAMEADYDALKTLAEYAADPDLDFDMNLDEVWLKAVRYPIVDHWVENQQHLKKFRLTDEQRRKDRLRMRGRIGQILAGDD